MLQDICQSNTSTPEIIFFYSTKASDARPLNMDGILFLPRLTELESIPEHRIALRLFITPSDAFAPSDVQGQFPKFHSRRLTNTDLAEALAKDGERTICYVCGPPIMTDEMVGF